MMTKLVRAAVMVGGLGVSAWGQAPVERAGGTIDLPTSKQIHGIVPGGPQQLSSLPVAMAVSPDGGYVVTVNGGYGSFESQYFQALAVLDTRTGKLVESPDTRTLLRSGQVLFSGLAFSADGRHLYGSIDSGADPEGKKVGDTGSGVQVYGFADGVITRERVLKIPLQPLAPGRMTKLGGGRDGTPTPDGTKGIPYPAGIALVHAAGGADKLLVADNLSDDALLMDPATGSILTRFDLAESDAVPSTYPLAIAVSADGRRGYIALWNASEVVELDLTGGIVKRKLPVLRNDDPVRPGSHPDALAMSPDGGTMYVALGNRDMVAAVDLSAGRFALKGYFDVRLPGQSFYGAQPESLAVSADGSRVYVANMGSDAVAVLDTRKLTRSKSVKGPVEPIGFIPTEWLPMSVASAGGKLYIATGKGTGTGPNSAPQPATPEIKDNRGFMRPFTYIATLLHGSLAVVDETVAARELKPMTQAALEDNRMKAAAERIQFEPQFAAGGGPIKHVIYIIRENRTYDQVLGDLQADGKPVGNGDPALAMYGEAVTPNLHKLALQFGVLDNFYDSAEVSGDGHVWSNTAIGTDYLERTWQLNYRGSQRGYDFEGVVSAGLPLEQHIPDVNEPQSGYLWGNLARHGKTLYHFGEFISTTFCNDRKGGGQQDSQQGPLLDGTPCSQRNEVKPGETLPAVWGGGKNLWPWAIPLIESNRPTKPELVGHFAPESPDFNLKIPDQIRVGIFLKHLEGWLADRQAGHDSMPNFIMLRLANDHTAGTTPGSPTPKSSVADNDLAVGRAVEAISHSPYWDDTAFFLLEDDAQNGADHVDAHRSLGVIVSKYAPKGPFVDSRFYSTVSMVRTMETILGLPPMNNNDALSSMMGSLFTGAGDQPAFVADTRNRDNGLIYQANQKTAPGAAASARMDFTHADRADAQKLNVILWQDAMGDTPVPGMLTEKRKKARKDDDD